MKQTHDEFVNDTLHMDEEIINNEEETDNIDISVLNELPTLPPRVPKRDVQKVIVYSIYFLMMILDEILYILGKDKIAIGIAKRKKASNLVSFEKFDVQTRHFEMLNWFVDKNVASIAVYGNGLISETEIENNPNNIHCFVLDSYLAIDEIKRYFDSDGWAALQQVVEIKRINLTWICKAYNDDSSNIIFIFHFWC